MPVANVYAIIDVAQYSLGVVRFVRYQTNPQGNIVYHGPAVDGTIRFVHEVAGQMNANSLTYTRNQNIYNDVVNGTFKRDTVSGWPSNPFGANSSIPKNTTSNANNTLNYIQEGYFIFENWVTRTGRDRGRNVRDGGKSNIYRKSGNYNLAWPSNINLLGGWEDVQGFMYGRGHYLTDVNILINSNLTGTNSIVYNFNPYGRIGTRTRGFHYYDRVLRAYNPQNYVVTIA